MSRVEGPSVPVAEVLLSLSMVGFIVVDPNSQASGIDDRLLGTTDSRLRQISTSLRQDPIMNHASVQTWFGPFAP